MQDPIETQYDAAGQLIVARNRKIASLEGENFRLRQLLSEAQKREREARLKALNNAAAVAYATCAETRHITLGDKVAAAIRALQSEER